MIKLKPFKEARKLTENSVFPSSFYIGGAFKKMLCPWFHLREIQIGSTAACPTHLSAQRWKVLLRERQKSILGPSYVHRVEKRIFRKGNSMFQVLEIVAVWKSKGASLWLGYSCYKNRQWKGPLGLSYVEKQQGTVNRAWVLWAPRPLILPFVANL